MEEVLQIQIAELQSKVSDLENEIKEIKAKTNSQALIELLTEIEKQKGRK